MLELKDRKLDTLTDYIKQLLIMESLKKDILNKVNIINKNISKDELVTIKTAKDGDNKFNVIITVTDTTLPKCFIVNGEYKFNSYIAEVIHVCDFKIKDEDEKT